MSTERQLPLTPWEQYMFLDDCRRGPMTFLFRLSYAGQLDRQRLTQSLAVVVARHPLLAAKVVRNRGRFLWDSFQPAIRLFGVPPAPQVPFVADHLDLLSTNGFRAGVGENQSGGHVWLEFHHAACDGLGAIEATAEIIAAYRGAAHELTPAPTTARLARRAHIPLTPLERITRTPKDLARIAKFFQHRIAPLTSGAEQSNSEFQSSAFVTHCFSPSETASLLDRVRRQGVTLNDLLLRDLYLSLHHWMLIRRDYGARALRIAMPISHRLPDDGQGAVNRVSMVFLDRTARQFGEPAELLASIASETRQIKQHRMGIAMLRSLKCLAVSATAMQSVLRNPRSQVTCILSNLGVVLASPANLGGAEPGIEFDSIEFMPPIRPQSPISFGAHTYRGSLTLTLRYDTAQLSATDAAELLNRYVDELSKSLACADHKDCAEQTSRDGAH
ncbi:MAG: hypothetical protein K1X71_12395 [Pirellulales bacterium]|nr:hypothetical protein [Pirellulales bacterium]